jgi:RIO kinase 1
LPTDFEALLRRLERRKQERLEKDSETYKIMASVFDQSTLITLYHLINRGIFDVFYGVVSVGKEANIFCALDKRGNYVAVKMYRIATSDFRNMHRYLAGDPRFRRVPKERRRVVFSWASREFKNLQRAHEAGVAVPKPLDQEKNVLAMEFIGEDGIPYPRMKDVRPEDPTRAFKILLRSTKLLYKEAGLIHSDLSEYNVLLTPDPVLIDFSMGTELGNPMSHGLLRRDLENLVRYFRKLGVPVPGVQELMREIVGEPENPKTSRP